MSDLVEWLTKILDEDEAIAKAATPGPWRHDPKKHWRLPGSAWFEEAVFAGPAGKDATCVAGTGESDDEQSMEDAAHIAAHDPASVLADIAAKRAILEQREQITVDIGEANADRRQQMNLPILVNIALALDTTIQHLASAYADRPGYDESWRP